MKQLENLHFIAFKPQSVMVSSKCLQEVNRLRQTYRPDLPQYSVPTNQGGTQKRKIKMEGACTSELSNPPKPKRFRTESGKRTKHSELSSPPELKQIKKTDTGSRKRKAASQTCDKQLPSKIPCSDRDKARNSKVVKRNPAKLIRCPTHPDNRLKLPVNRQNVDDCYRFNPVSEEWKSGNVGCVRNWACGLFVLMHVM